MTTDDEENAVTLVVLGHELPSSPSSDSSDSAVNAQGGGPCQDQQQQELVTINAVPGILNAVSVPTNPKRTNSIAHDDWVGHCSVILHVDLEHGGDKECGVIQLSAVAYEPKENKAVGKFDDYIKPPANAVWSNHASEVHGIYPTNHRIASAMGLVDIWKQFVMFIKGHLDHGSKKGIIAAWGGQSCNCEWLFRITQQDTHHG
jgi:hypothetical protein